MKTKAKREKKFMVSSGPLSGWHDCDTLEEAIATGKVIGPRGFLIGRAHTSPRIVSITQIRSYNGDGTPKEK